MKFVVTGGVGFIGSHVSKALIKAGHAVFIIDNLDPFYPIQLKQYNLEQLHQLGFSLANFYQIDIRDRHLLHTTFETIQPEIVIHLAAKAGVRPSIIDPENYFSTNVDGTLNVLQAARAVRVKKVLIASSSSVYGNNVKIPFAENDPVESQISPYASSKRAMEILAKTYHEVYGLPIQLFRFFTVYGPSGRPDMAPALFTKAILDNKPLTIFGGTETQRDYTFIDDVVQGLLKAIQADDLFAIYNLGNDHPEKLIDLIKAIEKATKKKAHLNIIEKQQGDVEKTWADITKARKQLKYAPKTSLEKGIKKFVDWYSKHQTFYN